MGTVTVSGLAGAVCRPGERGGRAGFALRGLSTCEAGRPSCAVGRVWCVRGLFPAGPFSLRWAASWQTHHGPTVRELQTSRGRGGGGAKETGVPWLRPRHPNPLDRALGPRAQGRMPPPAASLGPPEKQLQLRTSGPCSVNVRSTLKSSCEY